MHNPTTIATVSNQHQYVTFYQSIHGVQMYRPIQLTDQRTTNVTAERYSEYILNHENSRIVASYSPEPSPAMRVFYYYSQLVHIDQTIYDTTRIDHLIYVSNLPNQISLMTLRMRRLDKTQTKTPPDKC